MKNLAGRTSGKTGENNGKEKPSRFWADQLKDDLAARTNDGWIALLEKTNLNANPFPGTTSENSALAVDVYLINGDGRKIPVYSGVAGLQGMNSAQNYKWVESLVIVEDIAYVRIVSDNQKDLFTVWLEGNEVLGVITEKKFKTSELPKLPRENVFADVGCYAQ